MNPSTSRYLAATATWNQARGMAQHWYEGSLLVRQDCRGSYHDEIARHLKEAERAISIIAEVEMGA